MDQIVNQLERMGIGFDDIPDLIQRLEQISIARPENEAPAPSVASEDNSAGSLPVPHQPMNHGTSTNTSEQMRGRGPYKCRLCGVPLKNHVCPFRNNRHMSSVIPTERINEILAEAERRMQVDEDAVREGHDPPYASLFPLPGSRSPYRYWCRECDLPLKGHNCPFRDNCRKKRRKTNTETTDEYSIAPSVFLDDILVLEEEETWSVALEAASSDGFTETNEQNQPVAELSLQANSLQDNAQLQALVSERSTLSEDEWSAVTPLTENQDSDWVELSSISSAEDMDGFKSVSASNLTQV